MALPSISPGSTNIAPTPDVNPYGGKPIGGGGAFTVEVPIPQTFRPSPNAPEQPAPQPYPVKRLGEE